MRPVGRQRRMARTTEWRKVEEITHKGKFMQHVFLKGRRHSKGKNLDRTINKWREWQDWKGFRSNPETETPAKLRVSIGRSDRLICDPSVRIEMRSVLKSAAI